MGTVVARHTHLLLQLAGMGELPAQLHAQIAETWFALLFVQVQYGKQSQELKRPATSTIADLKAEVGYGRGVAGFPKQSSAGTAVLAVDDKMLPL